MTRMRRTFSGLLFALLPALAEAAFDPAAMRQKYIVGSTYHTMGWTGVDARNVDGIAGDEVLIGYTSMWHLLQWDPRTRAFIQLGFYENGVGDTFGGGGIQSVQFAKLDRAKPAEVALLSTNGNIGMFHLDGSLRAVWKPAVNEIGRLRFADLDQEPGDEVLLQTCSELTAWRFGASAPLWRIPVTGCAALLVADLDADLQPEIVLGSGDVFDGVTAAREWRYPLGFGRVLTSGDVDGDGTADLIGCQDRQCDAFDVSRRTNFWEIFLPYTEDLGAIAAGDIDSDGKTELFGGSAQHGYISKFSAQTGELLAQFPKDGGTNFVALANLDGDCDLELLWARHGNSTALDMMHVTDPVEMINLWSSIPEERGSSGVAVGDFSGTGHPSILWSSQGGAIARFVGFDPRAHVIRRISLEYDLFARNLPVATAAQLDADPAVEYVLPNFGGHMAVFDGVTHFMEWSQPLSDRDTVTSMTAGDLTGDGVPEVVAGLSILYFPRDHPQAVYAVDGATRKVLWKTKDELSRLLAEDCSGCIVQVAVADLNGDGANEVLALVPYDGLYAYEGRTGNLLWHSSLAAKAWAFNATDIDPSPGLEIIVPLYGPGRLVVLDATARTVLREKNLGQYGSGLSVQPGDLDVDGVKEIVVVADGGLLVLSAQTLDILWAGGFVRPWLSLGNQLAIADVDGDGTVEIVAASAHSLHVFEYRRPVSDTSPPAFDGEGARAMAATDCCLVSLEWDPAGDAASMPVTYRIHRSTIPGFVPDPWSLLAETGRRTYVDRTVSRDRTYYYAITAVDAAGNETTAALRASAVGPEGCRGRRRAVR